MKALISAGGIAAAMMLVAGAAQAQTVLTPATEGQPYNQSLSFAPGFVNSATYLPGPGTIEPAGLSPQVTGGFEARLIGTPTAPGSKNFTVRVNYTPLGFCGMGPCSPINIDTAYTLQVQPAVSTVPTLGEWAMMGLTAALALVGVALVSRRFVV